MTQFFNKTEYKALRKKLRNNPTKSEKLLWNAIKGKKFKGHKFRRQYNVGKYMIDFYCVKENLAVELDGEVHDSAEAKEYDQIRDDFLKNFGIKVVRIRNVDVECDPDGVLDFILRNMEK
ncbi:MAG TPA: endonuclease domain-containing protein [Ignavibacteria bacterium]|nr:cytosine methyltransferase [Bacteroidota bacterium]HRI86122.1 endonuclease domain-containing protein [Ignavibacteria bacterium]HRK00448.1 endonuclease domain-containing protein [Ignavibacteria bacterium]